MLSCFPASFAGEKFDPEMINQYCGSIFKKLSFMAERILKFYYHVDKIYKFSNTYQQQLQCELIMRRFVGMLMQKKLKSPCVEREGDRKIFLDLLINKYKANELSEADVLDEMDTILYTSVDTSNQLVLFTLLMIAIHPEVQEKLEKELKSVFCSPETPLHYDTLKQLEYLDMVIKETLRLFPIIPIVLKETMADIKLSKK